MVCEKAVALVTDLCMQESPLLEHKTCEEFLFLITNQDFSLNQPGKLLFFYVFEYHNLECEVFNEKHFISWHYYIGTVQMTNN